MKRAFEHRGSFLSTGMSSQQESWRKKKASRENWDSVLLNHSFYKVIHTIVGGLTLPKYFRMKWIHLLGVPLHLQMFESLCAVEMPV